MRLIFLAVVVICAYLLATNPDDEPTQATLDGIAATKCGNGVSTEDRCIVRKPLKGGVK
jgi:hypothetical protein